jgi:hypothetical protein
MSFACSRNGVTTPTLWGGKPQLATHPATASASARFRALPVRPRSVRPATSRHSKPRGRSWFEPTLVRTVSRLS